MSTHARSAHSVSAVVQTSRQLPRLLMTLYAEIDRTRLFVVGAAVAFFMLLALVPLLMVFSAVLASLPIPNLFGQLLDNFALFTPPQSMVYIKGLLHSIQTPNAGKILSVGVLSYLWAASGCFSSLIDALNIAYDVHTPRPWWRDKLQALFLTLTCGALLVVSLLCIVAGPRFGHFLSYVLPVPSILGIVWPPLRVILVFTTGVLGIEQLYYFGPNRRTTLRSTLPGAAFAVGVWFLGSATLSYYLQHLSNYSATYGSLGAIIGLMLWLYLSSCSILVGAELNAELIKRRGANHAGSLPTAAHPGEAATGNAPARRQSSAA
jgi:membrane protein